MLATASKPKMLIILLAASRVNYYKSNQDTSSPKGVNVEIPPYPKRECNLHGSSLYHSTVRKVYKHNFIIYDDNITESCYNVT